MLSLPVKPLNFINLYIVNYDITIELFSFANETIIVVCSTYLLSGDIWYFLVFIQ